METGEADAQRINSQSFVGIGPSANARSLSVQDVLTLDGLRHLQRVGEKLLAFGLIYWYKQRTYQGLKFAAKRIVKPLSTILTRKTIGLLDYPRPRLDFINARVTS
jgi:hypothetical protein